MPTEPRSNRREETPMEKTIDYYFTPPSPYSYLAGPRFKVLAQRNNLVVNWKPFDLFAAFALTGQKKVKERPPQIQANRLTELARWGSFLEMKINVQPKHFPPDPAPSHKMIMAAIRTGENVTDLTNAYMSACWAEERDIGDTDTTIAIANEQGFAGKDLFESTVNSGIQKNLDQNTDEAISQNVFGAPTWIYEGELFWGQDRIDFLTRAIEK
jgi:2-hydroxychromene-2-carboxylate isomerase